MACHLMEAPVIPDPKPGEVRLSREDLHALVWAEPMIRLAERFQITNFALSKVCRDHAVPMPPMQASAPWDLGRRIDAYADAAKANVVAHGHADYLDISHSPLMGRLNPHPVG